MDIIILVSYNIPMKSLQIKQTTQVDLQDILHVENLAFGDDKGPEIVGLVDDLLKDPTATPRLSLLAFDNDKPVGHILFTRSEIEGAEKSISSVILAPLAVIPEAQSQGVGRQLIERGLQILTESNTHLVFVLGHPGYYPRHGFTPAFPFGLHPTFPIPTINEPAWMVQELSPNTLNHVTGKITSADALNHPQYWQE